MTLAVTVAVLAFSAAATALLIGRTLPYLIRASMLDLPNDRSLHSVLVPRGAGLGIAGIVVVIQAWILATHRDAAMPADMAWWLGGASFALLGWWDDYRSRSAMVRLIAQFVIVAVFTSIALVGVEIHGLVVPAVLVTVVSTVLVVWVVNLFNFMDGADGYAGTQAFLYSVAAVALLLHSGAGQAAVVAAAIAGAALGFLYWNRAPARVFMGDSGSYFLGFQFAALAIVGVRYGQSIAPWIVLFALFLVDATFTLLRRLLSGESWWEAHRTHAFQVLILKGWSPNRLAMALAALTVFIYWPLAAWAVVEHDREWIAALLAVGLAGMIWFMIMRDHTVPTTNQ